MKQLINLGTGPDSGDGDTLYSGSVKINENFNELYATIGNAVTLDHIIGGDGIQVVLTTGLATINNTMPNVQSVWDADPQSPSAIVGQPVLADIATTGSYNDLLDTPMIPTLSQVALSGEYSDLLNAPVFPQLATVAVSGEYSDLLNAPPGNRLQGGVFIAELDSNIGEFRIPDTLRFAQDSNNGHIYGPGGGKLLSIAAGPGNSDNENGGDISLISGISTPEAGNGGSISAIAGDGAVYGGNVTITAGNGLVYGGNVVISSGAGTGDNVTYPGEVVIQTSDTVQWRYAQDGSVYERYSINKSSSATCPNGVATTIYTSINSYAPSIKLLITVTGSVTGDDTGYHTEALEAMIVCRPADAQPVVQLFNRTHTSTGPLVTVTATIDATSHLVSVLCEPTDAANSITLVALSTEPTT